MKAIIKAEEVTVPPIFCSVRVRVRMWVIYCFMSGCCIMTRRTHTHTHTRSLICSCHHIMPVEMDHSLHECGKRSIPYMLSLWLETCEKSLHFHSQNIYSQAKGYAQGSLTSLTPL